MSLFPTPDPTEKLKEKLSAYKTSKGTIKFTHEHPLSNALIEEIVRARIADIAEG
ncbi:MAG: hypothetical protein JWM07_735 [Candidatus Saccharibacteria bacterium]|nr:hypothetical protein [Candidatus Saccharibacteria bacterium]